MRLPPARPGTLVGVFAPSSAVPPERYARGLDALRGLGFTPYEPPGLFEATGYLAGSDTHRLELFHRLLEDPAIDVIWAARGGYGLHRIVDRIDVAKLRSTDKRIVGFSDICVLHARAQAAGVATIHGPVITQLAEIPPEDLAHTRRVVTGDAAGLELHVIGDGIARGSAAGPLLGGCLSVISPLVGTPFLPPLAGAILVLEDVAEATYRIDRMLTHLRLAGVFDRIAGLALGEFVACAPRTPSEQTLLDVLREVVPPELPLLYPLPFGHGRRHAAFPLGLRARIDGRRLVLEGRS